MFANIDMEEEKNINRVIDDPDCEVHPEKF